VGRGIRHLAETFALGLLQGPAELLPVSSSAHVELLPWLLGWEHARRSGEERKEVAVALHAGTALTLAAARGRRALARPRLLAAATVPPALAGLLLERPIERRLGTPRATALGLLAGSAALLAADRVPGRRDARAAHAVDGLWLGAAQAAALAPGVSRSGATRAAARARGFTPAAAVALSEEVALPVLAGAATLKGARLARRRPARADAAALAAGAAAAALSTAAALRLERRIALPAAAWAAYRTGLAGLVWVSDRRLRENRRR
jgi:undecaprenyl-diphosphatase